MEGAKGERAREGGREGGREFENDIVHLPSKLMKS
jgi:hypothetical protein